MTMEDEFNRMAVPRQRGRPTLEEVARRKVQTPIPVVEVKVPLPPADGIVCPACGKHMVPRVIRTLGRERHEICPCCGTTLVVQYSASGRRATVRPQ